MSDVVTEHLRLSILRVLDNAPSFTANDSIIHQVTQEFGIVATRDRIKTELAWLAEQGLVVTHEVMTVVVATLTERGGDVAHGRAVQPGVKRPSPGS
jgi:hypothetical protein